MRRWTKRWRLGALALAAGVALTGCNSVYFTTPAITVHNFFFYLNRSSMESAWQDLDLPLQEPGANHAVPAPGGAAGTSLRWPSQAAFNASVRRDLRPFLHGARISQAVTGFTAVVTVRAARPSQGSLYVNLHRVDNEWVFERMVVVGAKS